MVNYISGLVFVVLAVVGVAITALVGQASVAGAAGFAIVWAFLDLVTASSIRLAAQWEKAVVFRLGKFHKMKWDPLESTCRHASLSIL